MTHSQEALAQMVRTSYAALGKAAGELGDKIDWKPLDKGRSALDQVQECAGFGFIGEKIFQAQSMPALDMAALEKMRAENNTADKALPLLQHSAETMAKAIETFPPEKLGDKITLPFGGGMEKSFAEIALMVYWNAVYHEGQVNYIQTLCTPDA